LVDPVKATIGFCENCGERLSMKHRYVSGRLVSRFVVEEISLYWPSAGRAAK
jgi:hypothetical protein